MTRRERRGVGVWRPDDEARGFDLIFWSRRVVEFARAGWVEMGMTSTGGCLRV